MVLTVMRAGTRIHVGFAQNGDCVGIHRLLLPTFPELVATVIRGGSALCLRHAALKRAFPRDPGLYSRLVECAYRSAAACLTETTAGIAMTIEQRVARWLAQYARASGADELRITHQDLALFLGVRRSGVTVALHLLEGEHIIRSRRGMILLQDLRALEELGGYPLIRG